MKKLLLFLSLVISACGPQDRNCDDQIINSTPDMKESQADLIKPVFSCSETTRLDPSKTIIRPSYMSASNEWQFDCKLNTYCQKYDMGDKTVCWPYYNPRDWNSDGTAVKAFDEQLLDIYSKTIYKGEILPAPYLYLVFTKGAFIEDRAPHIIFSENPIYKEDILYQF